MEKKIIFATGNAGKMREIRAILSDLGLPVLSMKEAGVDLDIVEDGKTFAENAKIKAMAVWKQTGGIVLADDSGLAVDYIGGEPGVYSARYMGEDTSYEIKNRNIIERLSGAEGKERSARFVCNIAAVLEDGRVIQREAYMEGLIAKELVVSVMILFCIFRNLEKHQRNLPWKKRTRSVTEEKHWKL